MSSLHSRDHAYWRAAGRSLAILEANVAARRARLEAFERVAEEETGHALEPMFYDLDGSFAGYAFYVPGRTMAGWREVRSGSGVYHPKAKAKEMKRFCMRLKETAAAFPGVTLTDGLGLPNSVELLDGNLRMWTPAACKSADGTAWLIICPLANNPMYADRYKQPPLDAEPLTLEEFIELTREDPE